MDRDNAQDRSRDSAAAERLEFRMPRNGNWTRRDESSTRFMAMRKAGGRFKGVRREV